MTKRELIRQHALRCRPSKRSTYVTTHEALLAEAEYLQQTEHKTSGVGLVAHLAGVATALVVFLCLAIIKGWFA